MAVISVQDLKKSYGIKPILKGISFQVNQGDKIGIIGGNGVGKTTLFRLLTSIEDPDSGKISMKGDLRLGYLAQNVHIESDNSLFEECKKAYWRAFQVEDKLRDLEKQMGEDLTKEELSRVMSSYQVLTERFEEEGGLSYISEIRGILKGMGFGEDRFDDPVNVLSGGEKSRLELARMLSGRPDILLLDEPTNHLDIQAIRFLESFLVDFKGAVLLISHDRYFLDRICQRIFLIEKGRLFAYNCGYREYTQRRAKDLEVLRHAYENQQAEIARQQEIIDRLSKQGGSLRKRGIAQSRSRQKLLDKMVLVEAPPDQDPHMRFKLTPRYESGRDVLEVEDLAKSFDGRPLFQGVSFYLGKGWKVGLVGENGVGKTTLFRILLDKMSGDMGRVSFGSAVKTAYFDQEQANLDDDKTVIDEFWDAYPQMDHYRVRSNLAKFQFVGDDIFQVVGDLSGGEKSRLALLKLMLSNANLLLLDEPTNHLDIESREILEEALIDYEGTVLVISHDRYFLNHVCDHIFQLTPEGMVTSLGNYDDFLAGQEADGKEEEAGEGLTQTQKKKIQKKKRMKKEEVRKARAQIQDLDREIQDLQAQAEVLQAQALDPAIYEDYEEAMVVHDQLETIQKKIEEASDRWLSLSMELEGEEEE
ncbi:ribosomal protection-like ABC-F family protein [Kallipyga massiliensis]|uniref:ribosomal protection-like ABC-F family protein n=1 Tax=Kallipyga massiliensis TaxID=1472764 RepID=UPI0004B51683|nr:ABC-F family ATP-binding cassette domain-containing protein [Kallipyga massiliensis]